MRYSFILFSTRRESVSNIDAFSQELLVRAGYVHQLPAGIFTALHFGLRSLRKIEQVLREEMERNGGVEISMPLAATHEEVVAAIARTEIRTYRQLPKLLFQIQAKSRARSRLIRVGELVMDSYSLDADVEGLEKQCEAHFQAYYRIFSRLGLPVTVVQSAPGTLGGNAGHAFMYLTDAGEDTIFICENTGYRANKEIVTFKKPVPAVEALLPPEKVHTPGTKTIEEVARYLGVTPDRCGKIVFFSGMIGGEEKVIMAVVRGDMEVNKVKLQNLTKSKYVNPATEAEIAAIGSVPGYASPVGVDRRKALVVADDLIPASMNLVLGANEVDHHMKNLCYGRDYQADLVGDIVNAYEGALAPDARSDADVLKAVRGVELGHIFQLGTTYTDALEASYTDREGKSRSIVMGSCGIDLGRLLGCLAEEYHDERGLTLPAAVAPYKALIVSLSDSQEVIDRAEQLYAMLQAAGVEVLYDDRPKKAASPGERFNDADLIGIPVRLTVSERSLKNGGVELKRRRGGEVEVLGFKEVVESLNSTF
jgi:prolyl-tRNA synthetase